MRAGVSLALVVFILLKVDLSALADALAGMDLLLFGASFLFAIPGYGISVVRWDLLLKAVEQPFSKAHLLASYLVSSFFNLILPFAVGGDVVRAWDTRGDGFGLTEAAGVVFADRITGLVGVVVILALGLMWVPEPVWRALGPLGSPGSGFALVAVAGLAGLAGLVLLWKKAPGHGPLGAVKDKVARFSGVLLSLSRRPGPVVLSAGLGVLMQLNVLVYCWVLALALHLDMNLMAFFWFYPCWFLLMMLVPSIGGHGVREGGATLLLAPLIGMEQAIVMGTAMGLLYGAGQLPGAILGWMVQVRRSLDSKGQGEPG